MVGGQFLEFQADGHYYACNLLWVKEILNNPATTLVRQAPYYVSGLVHLRGQILTAINLGARLGYAKPTSTGGVGTRCIVFKTADELARLPVAPEGADAAEPDRAGILVDAVADILSVSGPILPAPPESLSGVDGSCIAGVISSPHGLISVLNIAALLTPPRPKRATAPLGTDTHLLR
jgi:purine-binding chemotaxis protein CheW